MSTVIINITGLEQGYNDTWTISSVGADGTESQRSLAVDTQGNGYSQSIGGKSSIVVLGGTTQKTQNGVARIVSPSTASTKTQSGKASIKATITKIQSGKADIKVSKSKTQSGLASVIQAITGTQKTIAGKASIKNNTTKNISGKADVKIQATKVISGISKVVKNATISIDGKASVINQKSQTITGRAKISASFVNETWDSYSTGTTAWAGWATKLNGLKVSNGAVISSTSSAPAVAYYSGKTFPANQYSKVQVVNKSGAGAVVRCGTGQYYYGIVCDTTTNTIYLRIYNGQYTHSNISTKQYTINVGDYLEVRIADGYITGLVNNSVVMGPYADPGLATSGSPGIVINSSTVGSVDNWTGGELPFGKTITGKSNITEYVPFLKVTDRFDTLDNWTTITGKTAFTLSANSISTGNNIDAAMFYSAGSFSKAQYAEARINLYASTCAGYILLRVNGSSWYQAKITLTGIYIQKVVNGAAPVNIGSYLDLSSYTDIGSCKWKFCISVTNELIVYKNGVFFSSWGTDTSIASGSPGLRILGTSAFGPGAIDSFEAGNYGPVKQTEISGRANIAFLQSRSTYGQSKVTRIEAKTQSGRSSIIKKVSQTQTGKARVGKTSIKTIDGKSRINVINNKTITATSRINKLHTEEQSGKSSIKNTIKSVITGKSSILVEYMLQRSMQGKASIKKTVTKQIDAISRIIVKNVRTITAKSSIKKNINVSQNGTANVTVEMKHSQHGMSAIISLLNKNMCGKANIVTIVPSISLLSSLPAMLEITSNITDKNAVRLLGKYGITTMEVIDNRKGAIRIQTSEGIKSIKQVNNK